VIADSVAASLGLMNGEDVIVQGIARSLPARTVALKELSFGSVAVKDIEAPVLPRAWLGADGYLGLDVIDGRGVTFDFHNHSMKVWNSHPDFQLGWQHENEALVRLRGSDGKLVASDCRVDGVSAHAFVDSGAQISIGNSHLFRELRRGGANYASDLIVPLIGVTGGSAPGRLTDVSRIKVGNMNFADSKIVIADLPVFDVWGLSDQPALFIGMNFLQQTSSFTIDYGRKELRFKLAQIQLASRV
jgi:predicted aspartyl protease